MKKYAVIVHIFYVDLWDELKARIKNITSPIDLFFTLSESIADKEGLKADILKSFPEAKIEIVENKGYDILPFLKTIKSLDLDKYTGIIKLHTKRDVDKYKEDFNNEWRGPKWRMVLLGFLETEETWKKVEQEFLAETTSMLADMRVIWRIKEEICDRFRTDLDVEKFCREHFGMNVIGKKVAFVAGTMFVAKPATLKPFQTLDLEAIDFKSGNNHEHSIAHVFERAFGAIASSKGKITAWQGEENLLKYIRHRDIMYAMRKIGYFFYRKKATNSGCYLTKVCKIPIWRSKS